MAGGDDMSDDTPHGAPGPDDFASKIPLFTELDKLMAWRGGPVNWDLAKQVAIKAVGDQQLDAADTATANDALRLADLWLEEATVLPSGMTGSAEAWTRVHWVEATLPVWRTAIDAVAAQVTAAMGSTLQQGLQDVAQEGLPPELAAMLPPEIAAQLPTDASGFQAMLGPMMGMLDQLSGFMFGSQVGQALGTLAGEVLTAHEIGLPLAPAGTTALIPSNIAVFGADLGVPLEEVRLFLALREVAAARLFAHVPWLRPGMLGAVEEYARGIRVDPDQIMHSVESLQSSGFDPNNPEALNQAMSDGLFDVPDSPEQQRALARLETLLTLVEGWIDAVTAAAARDRLPHTDALRETIRRRRAAGGPAETTFASLVGLTLRPRRLREAAVLWEDLERVRGIDGRDALWAHPDLLPNAQQLDDPAAFMGDEDAPSAADDPIAAIEALAAAGQTAPREAPRGSKPGDASYQSGAESMVEPPAEADPTDDEPTDPPATSG